MHLFFAIAEIGIGHSFGNPFLDSFEIVLHPAAGKDALAAGADAFEPSLRGHEKAHGVQ
jgi:hypothetical protein